MYLNHDKRSTEIDDEFENDNILSIILSIINKYKLIFIMGLILVIIIPIIYVYINKDRSNYIVLDGEQNIMLYLNSEYIEPGYKAYNHKNEDITSNVYVTSNVDISKIGTYEIKYTLGDTIKTRIITVVEKPKEYTYIYLKSINNSETVYLKVGDEYIEPGYKVFNSTGIDLTDKVKVTGEVDTLRAGSYKLFYSVSDSNGIMISAYRSVVVMDIDVSVSLNNSEYTNSDVVINVDIQDNYYDYMILPDGKKINDKKYSYKVNSNGKYIFKVFNIKGMEKEASIEVKNIDREIPSGSCVLEYTNNGSIIKINASDNVGIKKYEYDGKVYTDPNINVSTYIDNAQVVIYDKAENTKTITCKITALPVITKISNDSIIVTVNAKKVDSDIAGYYFSYTDKRPDKNTGGYLETSNASVDVVRLIGTTYVWVEDKSGRISKPATISISAKNYPMTGSGYTIIRGTKLSDQLTSKGTSLEKFNKLMARSVRAAGLYTKEAAATAAATLNGVLAYKYKFKIPYWMGGKTNSWGAYYYWGGYRENPTFEGYDYYGMDCDGLVNWAFMNAGVKYPSGSNYYHWRKSQGLPVSKNNGDIGDVMVTEGHVKIIIGKTDREFIIAEASGRDSGLIINRHAYSNTSNYVIIKGEKIVSHYGKNSKDIINKNFPAF